MELTKKQAIDQSILIWERIAETGQEKPDAILDLFGEGKLPTDDYRTDCPLCEYSVNRWKVHSHNECWSCPWGGPNHWNSRCNQSNSPYREYLLALTSATMFTAPSKKDIKKAACKMVKYLKSLKEDK